MSDKTLTIEIGGKTYDLAKAAPLTLGNLEDMEAAGLIHDGKVAMSGPKQVIDFLHVVVLNIDADITREQVRAVSSDKLVSAVQVVMAGIATEGNPTTPLGGPTS